MILAERARSLSKKGPESESWEELYARERVTFDRLVALEEAGRLTETERRALAHLRHVRPDLERFRRGEIPEPLTRPVQAPEKEEGAGFALGIGIFAVLAIAFAKRPS